MSQVVQCPQHPVLLLKKRTHDPKRKWVIVWHRTLEGSRHEFDHNLEMEEEKKRTTGFFEIESLQQLNQKNTMSNGVYCPDCKGITLQVAKVALAFGW